jgi:nucleoside-diphosphate-sugar epimerase
MATRILITGGAGFVGSNLALALRRRSNDVVIAAFDNLRRRGSDLSTLVAQQIAELARYDGATYNVGGGPERSVSLAELTELCRERTGRPIPIGSNPTTSPADVPYYVTDTSQVTRETGWSPRHGMTELLDDVFQWLQEHRETLEPLMAGNVSTDVPALHARTAS